VKRKNDKKGLSSKAKKKLLAEAKARKQSYETYETRAEYRRRQNTDEKADWAKNKLRERRKLTRNIKNTIELLFSGEKIPRLLGLKGRLAHIAQLEQRIQGDANRDAAKRLLLKLEEHRSKILECGRASSDYQNAIRNLCQYYRHKWIRQPEDWEPSSKNPHKQFAGLVRHLMAEYDVPLFMDSVWFSNTGNYQFTERGTVYRLEWWVHVARGGNIRKAAGLPVPLTKKMAHYMMQAPNNYNIDSAIRWGQIHALGGNERNVRGLLGTFLCRGSYENDEFWQSVFRYFIAQPMLDAAQYGPIIDYLRNQKFIVPRGAEEPPQPNLTMKRRDPNTLLGQVEAWHTQLAKTKGARSWEQHKTIGDMTFTEGKKEQQKTYHVTELLNSKELRDEGKRLSHCVASYDRSCAAGNTSIFSVRRDLGSGLWEPLGTIEVHKSKMMVVQFSAKYNKKPGNKAYQIMKKWAIKHNLTLSGWV
jgi:hypothetical protein